MAQGQVIQRGEKTWLVRVPLGCDPAAGRRKYHNKTIHGSKKDAQRYLTKKLRERDTGVFIEPSRKTLNEFLDEWLETAMRHSVRQRTFEDYRSLLRLYVRPALGHRQIGQLTAMEIQRLYTDMRTRGLSARTVRYTHSVLHNALGQAVRWQLLPQNVAKLVELPRVERKEIAVFSKEDAAKFLTAAESDRWHALWVLLLTAGLRPGEALGLRWTDLEGNKIRVQRTLISVHRGGPRFEEPKTARGRRTVTLPESTVKALQRHRSRQAEEKLRAGPAYEDQDLIFAGKHGKPLEYQNLVRRHYKGVLAKAGLPPIRLYALRHSCATLLLLAGENPKVVGERLGHSSSTLTLDTYSHVLPDIQQRAAEKLEHLLFPVEAQRA